MKKIVNYPSVFKDFMVKEFIVETNVNENDSSVIKLYDKLYDQQLRLTILPTLQCNFRCEYCYETFKNEFISQDEIDLLCKAISIESKGKTGIFIDWFGGEPLLAIEAINKISAYVIKICHFRRIPFSASITANGYLLSKDIFEQMLKNKIYSFQITLDETESFHDSVRHLLNGNGSFHMIKKNLLAIKEIKSSSVCFRKI